MKILCYFACFFIFLEIISATGHEKSGCLEREKALALLETAEDLLSKAGAAFPSCKLDFNSTNHTDCESEKPLAYIEISKKLISDIRENFPTCTKPFEKDDNNVTKPIEKDNVTKPIENDDITTPKPIEKDNVTKPIEKDNVTKPIENDDITTPKPIEKDVLYGKPADCSEVLANGLSENGVYTIWPSENKTTENPLQVYCDMKTDNGGWTVIQRRGKFPVQQDFYLDWESYKNGFGKLTEEFWLGNENIRVLCHKGCEIRFDLQDAKGNKSFAVYKSFKLRFYDYTLEISGYSGDAGDGMIKHNNYPFSTKDKFLTKRASDFHGGWWYRDTDYFSNLNGNYLPIDSQNSEFKTIFWYPWRRKEALSSVEMKVRPKKI